MIAGTGRRSWEWSTEENEHTKVRHERQTALAKIQGRRETTLWDGCYVCALYWIIAMIKYIDINEVITI